MFSDNLSVSLLVICEERGYTQEELAAQCGLSGRFINNIICRHSAPRITSLEKICVSLQVTPNDLLVDARDKLGFRQPMLVTAVRAQYPVCPRCLSTVDRDFQAFCDRCGQKLAWEQYSRSKEQVL